MPRKKRWSHIKKRGKSCYKRVSFKQREKNYNDTKFNKNRKTKPKRKIKLKLKLNKKQNKKVIRAAVASVRSPLSIISQNHNTVRRPSISPYTHAVNQNKRPPTAICQADVSITWNDVGKQNRVLHHQVSQLKKRLYASERRNILYQHDINIITEKTFHPQFAAAFNDFIKIRLKCNVLKNSKCLDRLVEVMDVYNQVKNTGKNMQFEVGGTSYGSIDRVMQYRASELFLFETCIVMNRCWIPEQSKMTLYHDECSQRNESQLSIVMAFNTKIAEDSEFIPHLRSGNIIRGIRHRNIPGKESHVSLNWGIKPAISALDDIGCKLYEQQWIKLPNLIQDTLAVMSDQNNGALKLNKMIGDEYKVRNLVELICLMHNVDNMLGVIIERLLLERANTNDANLRNLRNVDINQIGIRIQKCLNRKFEGHQNKGELFTVFISRIEGKSFIPFTRVVGDRKQWEIKNVEASLSRREEMGAFSMKTTRDGKHLVADPRLLYEYSKSYTLLQESLIITNIRRQYVLPLMSLVSTEVEQMNRILPILKQSLDQCQYVATNTLYAIRTLFTLSKLIGHETVHPYILTNKLLSEDNVLAVLDCTDNLGQWINDDGFDFCEFMVQVRSTFDQQEQVSDRYYAHIIQLQGDELQGVIIQLQGAYHALYTDFSQRYQAQSTEEIPDSALGTNDITESLNGCGKYHGSIAPNIAELTKNAMALNALNRHAWYTWDYLISHEPAEFERVLRLWLEHCGTYRMSIERKKEYQQKYHSEKWKKLRCTLSTASDEDIPVAKANPAQGKAKVSVFKHEYRDIAFTLWRNWVRERNEYLQNNLGILVSFQRRQLKQRLGDLLRNNTAYTVSRINSWGLDKRQLKLYEYCIEMVRRNGALQVRH
eukprot:831908_1